MQQFVLFKESIVLYSILKIMWINQKYVSNDQSCSIMIAGIILGRWGGGFLKRAKDFTFAGLTTLLTTTTIILFTLKTPDQDQGYYWTNHLNSTISLPVIFAFVNN